MKAAECGAAPDSEADELESAEAWEMGLVCRREAGHEGQHGAEIWHYWGPSDRDA